MEEAADLPDERQAMRSCDLRFGASSGGKVVHNCGSDERISCLQASVQKTVQAMQDATFLSIAVTHCIVGIENSKSLGIVVPAGYRDGNRC